MEKISVWILLAIAAYYLLTQPVGQPGVFTVTGIPFTALAKAIQTEEGYYPGSRAYRNNNPGNLRYAGQAGTVGADPQGFAIFADYTSGFNALIAQLRLDASRHPDWSLWDFVSNYAPASDNNNVASYVSNLINSLSGQGYNVDTNTNLGAFA